MSELLRRVKGFFVPGEKDAFLRIQELAGLAEEALQLLVKILSSPINGLKEIESYTERINLLEKDGDKITRSLEEMIGRGSMTASLDYDFGRLADNVDSILDRAHALSRQLRRVTRRPLREAKEFDSDIRKERISLIEIGLAQLRMFRKLLNTAGSNRSQAIDLARQIESLEEQGDDVKDSMLDEIYGSWEKLDYASFHNYLETKNDRSYRHRLTSTRGPIGYGRRRKQPLRMLRHNNRKRNGPPTNRNTPRYHRIHHGASDRRTKTFQSQRDFSPSHNFHRGLLDPARITTSLPCSSSHWSQPDWEFY